MRFLLILAFFSIICSANVIQNYIDEASKLKLSEKKQWHILLHMLNDKSEIRDKNFFYAKDGFKNPQEELEATIRAFYQSIESVEIPKDFLEADEEVKVVAKSRQKEDYHALCRFKARFRFLNDFLDFKDLPLVKCKEYEENLKYINPKSVTIIFPTAFMGSPASMFGHTMLLLNSDFKSRLLSFAVNFSAQVDSSKENPIKFAFKGIFGGYSGQYSILPYYEKLKEYQDMESRDIWEIDLNFSQLEVLKIFEHIWELRDIKISYFYLNKNCSYNLFWLLEIARPSINLHQYFFYQVNPPETLFAMQKEKIVLDVRYRPSKQNKILFYEKKLDFKSLMLAKKIAMGETVSLSSQKDIVDILDLSAELSEFYFIKQRLKYEQYIAIAHHIASLRSKLGNSSNFKLKSPISILNANQGARFETFLISKNTLSGMGISFRLAYHSIDDNDIGYLRGSQIEFLKGSVFLDASKQGFEQVQINEAKIFSLSSFGMIGTLFQPISFRIQTGFDRSFVKDTLAYYMSGGVGMAYAFNDFLYSYYLLEPIFYILETPRMILGNSLGVVFQSPRDIKMVFEYQNRLYKKDNGSIFSLSFSYRIVRNLDLFYQLQAYLFIKEKDRVDQLAGVRIYF